MLEHDGQRADARVIHTLKEQSERVSDCRYKSACLSTMAGERMAEHLCMLQEALIL